MRFLDVCRILVISGLFTLSGCSKPATEPNVTSPANTTGALGENPATPSSAATPQAVQPAPIPPAPPIVVPSGTRLTVVIDQAVSSKTSNAGDHFDASLASSIAIGGKRAIARGARIAGTVTDAKSAGKFHGNAAITVTLDSISVNGERYPIRTSSITEAGKGRGKRTGIGAGGGAVVGGIIGALAGGGKGAAIGAGAGAGAGAAGAGFTGDRDIEIRPETTLSFVLRRPIEIPAN